MAWLCAQLVLIHTIFDKLMDVWTLQWTADHRLILHNRLKVCGSNWKRGVWWSEPVNQCANMDRIYEYYHNEKRLNESFQAIREKVKQLWGSDTDVIQSQSQRCPPSPQTPFNATQMKYWKIANMNGNDINLMSVRPKSFWIGRLRAYFVHFARYLSHNGSNRSSPASFAIICQRYENNIKSLDTSSPEVTDQADRIVLGINCGVEKVGKGLGSRFLSEFRPHQKRIAKLETKSGLLFLTFESRRRRQRTTWPSCLFLDGNPGWFILPVGSTLTRSSGIQQQLE